MSRLEQLKDLLSKIESGEFSNAQKNAEIDALLRVGSAKLRKSAEWAWAGFPRWRARKSDELGWICEVLHADDTGGVNWKSEKFCTSIDAAMLLKDATLPDWEWGFDGSIAWVKQAGLRTSYRADAQNGMTALAFVIAILKALIAQEATQ